MCCCFLAPATATKVARQVASAAALGPRIQSRVEQQRLNPWMSRQAFMINQRQATQFSLSCLPQRTCGFCDSRIAPLSLAGRSFHKRQADATARRSSEEMAKTSGGISDAVYE